MSTIIKNGTIVTASDICIADLKIDNGIISGFGIDLEHSTDNIIDASDKYIFPGGIDLHCHLASKNVEHATIAAAYGGTTCFVEPAVQQVGHSLAEGLDDWQSRLEGKSAIDYGLHMTVTDPTTTVLAEFGEMVEAGVTSIKLFTATFPGTPGLDDVGVLNVLQAAKENKAIVILHAENDALVDHLVQQALMLGKKAPIYGALTRPKVAEAEAISRVLMFARHIHVPVYFYHVSCEMALRLIGEAQHAGQVVFAETCPHYLFLTEEKYQLPGLEGSKFLCAPPIHEQQDQDALWKGLIARTITVVSSDHTPVSFHGDKDIDDFTKVRFGIPGIETRLPLLYSGVVAGKISLNRFVELISTAPAKLAGMYPQKGAIAPGSDADLVIFDPNKEITISVDKLHQPVDYTVYEGIKLLGYPTEVLLRGKSIIHNGEYVGELGDGKYVSRKPIYETGSVTF